MKHLVNLAKSPWISPILAAWTLVMLGVILVALSPSPASKPALPKVQAPGQEGVAAEGGVLPPEPIRPPPVERVTFRERWSPVSLPALPATTVTPVTLVAPPPMRAEPAAAVALLPQPEIEPGTPVRIIPRKQAPGREGVERKAGTCERHGLRKVWVSDRRWRCRR
jgi:hypothetical protein